MPVQAALRSLRPLQHSLRAILQCYGRRVIHWFITKVVSFGEIVIQPQFDLARNCKGVDKFTWLIIPVKVLNLFAAIDNLTWKIVFLHSISISLKQQSRFPVPVTKYSPLKELSCRPYFLLFTTLHRLCFKASYRSSNFCSSLSTDPAEVTWWKCAPWSGISKHFNPRVLLFILFKIYQTFVQL